MGVEDAKTEEPPQRWIQENVFNKKSTGRGQGNYRPIGVGVGSLVLWFRPLRIADPRDSTYWSWRGGDPPDDYFLN